MFGLRRRVRIAHAPILFCARKPRKTNTVSNMPQIHYNLPEKPSGNKFWFPTGLQKGDFISGVVPLWQPLDHYSLARTISLPQRVTKQLQKAPHRHKSDPQSAPKVAQGDANCSKSRPKEPQKYNSCFAPLVLKRVLESK